MSIGAGAGAGAAGAGTFCPEPEPELEPPNRFTRSRSRSRSRNASPEPEPEPTKNVTALHPWLPVMIREEYGQMAHQTLPNILLSDASLVTKSYIARFVDDDAIFYDLNIKEVLYDPSALSNCSTGPSPPLAHGKSTLSPSQANAGCPQPGLFGRFRSISEQTVHRSRKIRAQCERPPIHVLKTQVSCPSVQ